VPPAKVFAWNSAADGSFLWSQQAAKIITTIAKRFGVRRLL
jgi:hypothetical protein